MRERGVPHRHLDIMCRSITELEMWAQWRGLCTDGDRALLLREGYIDDAGELTPLGAKTLADLTEQKSEGR